MKPNKQLTPSMCANLATKYNTKNFIKSDPVQFLHKYSNKRDIEIIGIIAQWFSYGSRDCFLSCIKKIEKEMLGNPFYYISERLYMYHKFADGKIYRFYSHMDFFNLCERIREVYGKYPTLEDAYVNWEKKSDKETFKDNLLRQTSEEPADPVSSNTYYEDMLPCRKLAYIFKGINGIPDYRQKSAFKRLNMFLRWMVRNDRVVDLGLWKCVSPAELIIPLDVHVQRQAALYGISDKSVADLNMAVQITEWFKGIWEDDPVKGDFVLFGLGVDKKRNIDSSSDESK